MQLIDALQQYPSLYVGCVALLGLAVGSFINVVCYRLPKMLEYQWQSQCKELLSEAANDAQIAASERYDLFVPRSRCPHCEHPIRAWENIPVISYLFLGGKCSKCNARISSRYPIVELASGILAAVTAWRFGFSLQAGAGLLLTWGLLTLAVIDLEHQLLPDAITLPVLWVGLLISLYPVFVPSTDAILGAATGYLVLWLVFMIFKLATGKEGMGFGDFKLLGALGAWIGWKMLPVVIIFSSLVGAFVGAGLLLLSNHRRGTPIPFGPFLAAAGWIALLWGSDIIHGYLHWSGLSR